MTADDLQAYRARWAAVAERQREAQRNMTMEQRWRQFNALYAMGKALGLLPVEDRDEAVVRERWNRLRAQYEAYPNDPAWHALPS